MGLRNALSVSGGVARYGNKASSQYKDAKAQAQDPANWEAAKKQAADAAEATKQQGHGLLNKVTHSVTWLYNKVFIISCRQASALVSALPDA